jgi:hypothetical protein
MAKSPVSQIICLSAEQVEKLLEQLRAQLDPATYELVESLLRTLEWLMGIIQTQKTSLGRLVRIVAQPIFQATRYELEWLRCKLCGATFTAPVPPEAGTEKYAPNVGPMLALLR